MIILRFEVRVSFAQLSHVPIKTSSLMNSHKSPGQISLQLFLHLISTDLPSSAPRFPFIPPIPLCCLLKQSRGRLFKWSSLDWRAALSRWKPGTQTGLILKVEREREREGAENSLRFVTNFLTHVGVLDDHRDVWSVCTFNSRKAFKGIFVSIHGHQGLFMLLHTGEYVKSIQDLGSWPEPLHSIALNTVKDRWALMGNYTIIAVEC